MQMALLSKKQMLELYGKEIEIIPKIENTGHTAYIEYTSGCPKESACHYCNFYRKSKFSRKPLKGIIEHIEKVSEFHRRNEHDIRRVFIGAGDCFSLKGNTEVNENVLKETHVKILNKIRENFPVFLSSRQTYKWFEDEFYETEEKYEKKVDICNFISTRTILDYGQEDLGKLKDSGLKYIYWGVESGSDKVLSAVNKGCSVDEILKAGKILNRTGFEFTAIILLGAAGDKLFNDHINKTSDILKKLRPSYISFSGLEIFPDTPYHYLVRKGKLDNMKQEKLALQKELIKLNLDTLEYVDEEYHV